MKPHSAIVLLILVAVGIRAPLTQAQARAADAQITRETYDRANQMRGGILSPKLKNGFVVPHWIGQRDAFWYKRETAKGYEFVQVDAATGHTRPAFDHEKLAHTLSALIGTQVSADKLPFDSFEFNADSSAIHITVADKNGTKYYDCKLDAGVCTPAPAATPPAPFEITIFDRVPPETHDPNEGVLRSPDNHWGIIHS